MVTMSEHVKNTLNWKLKSRKAVRPAEKESLLDAVRRAAQLFEKLSEEYAEAAEGYRVQIYNFCGGLLQDWAGIHERPW